MGQMKDHTFIVIGIFLAVVLLPIIYMAAVFENAPAGDIMWGLLALCGLEILCFLAHKVNNKS